MRAVNSSVAIVSDNHVFEIPSKLIRSVADMKMWERSEAYFEYLGFVLAINDAIKGKSNSRGSENLSDAVKRVVAMLDALDVKIDETPPIQQPQRFGNVAFRAWFKELKENSLLLMTNVVGVDLVGCVPEVGSYMMDSFGNSTRIDYGTGHEIAFLMFLCCLFKIGLLKDADKVGVGCAIFPRYLDLVRKLQTTYRMEPAGSHGVWSLDDFQFVPFIWGSSQLFAHPQIEPSGFLLPHILNQFGEDYMFLTCIKYINSVKTGPFAEHSNQLWSISGVSSWSKINGGLIKMYKAEVLSKFPVVQHIVFGSLFTLRPMEQCTGLMSAKTSMVPPPIPFPRSEKSSRESLSVLSEKSSAGSKISVMSGHSSEKEVSDKSVGKLSGGSEQSVEAGSVRSGQSVLKSPSARSEEKSPSQTDISSYKSERSAAEAKEGSVGSQESGHKGVLGEISEPSGYLTEADTISGQAKRGSELLAHGEETFYARAAVDEDAKPKKSSDRIGLRTSAHLGVREPPYNK